MLGTEWRSIAEYVIGSRADYSTSITHWTKTKGVRSGFDVLKKILADGRINGSTNSGFIKGSKPAACFTEIPISSMCQTFQLAAKCKTVGKHLKWEPYGLSFLKPVIYKEFNGRPVLYLSEQECITLFKENPSKDNFLWRVVGFDQTNPQEVIDFSHEREWRVPGDVDLSKLQDSHRPIAIVRKTKEAIELQKNYMSKVDAKIRSVFSLEDLKCLD